MTGPPDAATPKRDPEIVTLRLPGNNVIRTFDPDTGASVITFNSEQAIEAHRQLEVWLATREG